MNTARVSIEGKRGCGYRKKGGLYLMGDRPNAPCDRLPIELKVCPICHAGIKPSRGWTWINPRALFGQDDCGLNFCGICPCGLATPEEGGLLWIGTQHYQTARDYMKEAATMGLSRRLTAVPKRFEAGKTQVYLAHRQAIIESCTCTMEETGGQGQKGCSSCGGKGWIGRPGIFTSFRPTHVEKVVDRDTPEEECEQLRKRGIDPVIVVQRPENGAEG